MPPNQQAGGQKTGGANPLTGIMSWVIGILLIVIVGAAFFGCFNFLGLSNNKDDCVFGAATSMLQVGAFIAHIVAFLFDFTISRTVVNAGSIIGQSGVMGPAIQTAWTVVRDLVNIAFIAGLVWASFSIILQTTSATNSAGKLVAKILLAALLVNFSYFFAGAIIDASNFSATIIYKEALGGTVLSLEERAQRDLMGAWNDSTQITDQILAVSGLANLVYITEEEVDALRDKADVSNISVLLVGFMGALLLMLFAFVLFQGAAILFKRFIAIILLLIFSPVAILNFIDIGGLKKFGDQWWKTLTAQALFPPVFFLLLAIALKVSESALGERTADDFSIASLLVREGSSVTWAGEVGSLLFTFALVMGLVYAAIKISDNISQETQTALPTSKDINNLPKIVYGATIQGGAAALPKAGRIVDTLSFGSFGLAGKYSRALGRGAGDLATSTRRLVTDRSIFGGDERKAERETRKRLVEEAGLRANRQLTNVVNPTGITEEEKEKNRQDAEKALALILASMSENQRNTWYRAQDAEGRARAEKAVPDKAEAMIKAFKRDGAIKNPKKPSESEEVPVQNTVSTVADSEEINLSAKFSDTITTLEKALRQEASSQEEIARLEWQEVIALRKNKKLTVQQSEQLTQLLRQVDVDNDRYQIPDDVKEQIIRIQTVEPVSLVGTAEEIDERMEARRGALERIRKRTNNTGSDSDTKWSDPVV